MPEKDQSLPNDLHNYLRDDGSVDGNALLGLVLENPKKALEAILALNAHGLLSKDDKNFLIAFAMKRAIEKNPSGAAEIIKGLFNSGFRDIYKTDAFWSVTRDFIRTHPKSMLEVFRLLSRYDKDIRQHGRYDHYLANLGLLVEVSPDAADEILRRFVDTDVLAKIIRDVDKGFGGALALMDSLIEHRPDLAVPLIYDLYDKGLHTSSFFWDFISSTVEKHPDQAPNLASLVKKGIDVGKNKYSLTRALSYIAAYHPDPRFGIDLLADAYKRKLYADARIRGINHWIRWIALRNPEFFNTLVTGSYRADDPIIKVFREAIIKPLARFGPLLRSDSSVLNRHMLPLAKLLSKYRKSEGQRTHHAIFSTIYFPDIYDIDGGVTHDGRTDAFSWLIERLLRDGNLSKQHALLLALALHDIDKRFPGIHIERELPARQAIISKILAPHNTTTSEIMDHPILRKLARLYSHYLGADLHDLTVALRDAVIHAQVHQVMDAMDRDYFHNHTPTTPDEAKEYINRAKEIYERTNDPSAYLTYVLSRVFDKNISRDALAHIVALNASLRKGGFERGAHGIIHNHEDIVEKALRGDKNALRQLKSLVHLALLRELLIDKDPQLFHELGLHEKENITLSKWKEILERAKRDERLKEYISTVTSLPISGVSLDASSKWNLDKLVRMRRFERENVGAYEALLHAIQTGRVADEHIQKLKELPTHKLMDSVLKILYADGAIDEGKYRKIVQKLRSTPAKDLPKTFEQIDHEIRDILQAHYYTPFTLFGNIHETPRTPVETFVERALDELHERISAHHAALALQMTRPKARENLWKDIHKLNKIPPDVDHPLQLVRELPAHRRSEPVASKAFEKK